MVLIEIVAGISLISSQGLEVQRYVELRARPEAAARLCRPQEEDF